LSILFALGVLFNGKKRRGEKKLNDIFPLSQGQGKSELKSWELKVSVKKTKGVWVFFTNTWCMHEGSVWVQKNSLSPQWHALHFCFDVFM